MKDVLAQSSIQQGMGVACLALKQWDDAVSTHLLNRASCHKRGCIQHGKGWIWPQSQIEPWALIFCT